MIEITLVFHGREVDLAIPGRVTFDRLGQLLRAAFAEKDVTLPADFTFEVGAKALAVSGADLIASFGVGNGDRLHITTPKADYAH